MATPGGQSAAQLCYKTGMVAADTLLRRVRRTDFTAVMGLLAAADAPIPPPDRRSLHRFRHLAADLGADCYLAFSAGVLAGLVHVTYARHLAAPPVARIERLVVAAGLRQRGVGRQLLDLARARATRRGCGTLELALPADASDAAAFLAHAGFTAAGSVVALPLPAGTPPGVDTTR